ncbi:DNA/RNA non-specific endonuclease [Thalassospira xianhensis]|uniref:DNA/RNA non-specific endonuclease n=1 Tax=Thalassospira xianhensis TaxID=478503 RepID=UPI000DEDA097|nr:DNA/RNA non-specific endonuclease [Thalassospira xianhensis]
MQRISAAAILVAATLVSISGASAAPTACPSHYVNGEAPDIINQKLAPKTREVCFEAFGVLHSGITRTPLFSAEYLTVARLSDARGDERNDTFHEEQRLPEDERSELSDYKRSGWDRGHLAPSADMPDPETQHESFSMANMIPQAPNNNRGVWANIERAVRELTFNTGEVYVVSGPAFIGSRLETLKRRVVIPTHVWKAVYVPSQNMASAYLTVNASGSEWQEISIQDLAEMTGIDPFPSLTSAVKQQLVDLPDPIAYNRQKVSSSEQNKSSQAAKVIGDALFNMIRR